MDLCRPLVVRKKPELVISTEAGTARTIRLRELLRENVIAGTKIFQNWKYFCYTFPLIYE